MIDNEYITYSDLKPRYNNIGEWKPLIFTGDTNALGKEVYELTEGENDKRIYGVMYYIKATSFQVIEFIVKTHFQIPTDFQQIGSQYGKIQLHKLNFDGYANLANTQIYDGTLELVGDSVEDIKSGLHFIDVLLHRIAFRLDTKVEWFIKYPHHDNDPDNIIYVSEEDLDVLRKYLIENLKGSDSIVFDVAISWYMTGNNSNNPFVKFLSYCIAMEALVDRFLSGKMEVSSKYGISGDKENESDVVNCIHQKHTELYMNDPKLFVEEAYFNCIKGIKKQFRSAVEIVFGSEHEYMKYFFDKTDKYTIYDLRSKLAHGSFTALDEEHVELITKNLPYLKHIAHEFILRLSTGTKKDTNVKDIKPKRSFSFTFSSPRGTGVASSLSLFPNKDWRIKPEWLF